MANYKDIKYQFPTSAVTSGTFADGRISESSVTQHAATVDLQPIKSDVTALALREATNENSAAFNLPNQFIETFTDDTNLGTQTNGDRTSGYWTTVIVIPLTQIAQGTGTTIGSMTESGGIAAAFDGDTTQNSDEGARLAAGGSWGHHVGKDYESGNTYTVTQMKVTNISNEGLLNEAATNAEHRMRLEYSDDGSAWSTAWESEDSFTRQANIAWGATATITSSTAGTNNISSAGSHRYWRYNCKGNNSNGTNVAEVEFWVGGTTASSATGTLIQAANTVTGTRTEVGGTMLYKDNEGTATLGTDLKIYFTCDNSNWTEAASYNAITPVYSSGIKQVRLGKTTCTGGTDVRYKAVWANQSEGSKETQLHGIGINY